MEVLLTFCNYLVSFASSVWNNIIIEEHDIVIGDFVDRIQYFIDDIPIIGDLLSDLLNPLEALIVESFPLHTPFYVVLFSWVIGVVALVNFIKLFL